MKKILFILSLFLLALLPNVFATGIIARSGFEGYNDIGWSTYTCTNSTTYKYNGTYSLKLSTAGCLGNATRFYSGLMNVQFWYYMDASSVGNDPYLRFLNTGSNVVAIEGQNTPIGIEAYTGSTWVQFNNSKAVGEWKFMNLVYDEANNNCSVNISNSTTNMKTYMGDCTATDNLINNIVWGSQGTAGTYIDDFKLCDGICPVDSTPPSSSGLIQVTLLSPINNTINNTNLVSFYWNNSVSNAIAYNASLWTNMTGVWQVNTTNGTTPITINGTNSFPNIVINNDGNIVWAVSINNGTNEIFPTANFSLTIDTLTPTIEPEAKLGLNKLVVFNGSLNSYINFSDERDIYSINVSLDGTQIFGVENLGIPFYRYNLTNLTTSDVTHKIVARVCDSHTANLISPIPTEIKDKEIQYIFEKNMLWNTKYVYIYPKDKTDYTTPNTEKLKDRYTFTFTKSIAPSLSETFIVESSSYIDIVKNSKYKGHLVIPALNRWIDFENFEASDYSIKRISDTKIEVIITGLKSKTINFNSIGELNCDTATYYFMNLNPTYTYDYNVFVAQNATLRLNVTLNTSIMSYANATLYYNGTAYYVGNVSNFTKNITVPNIGSANENISFYWYVGGDSYYYNLTEKQQTIQSFFMESCNNLNGSRALNFSFYDERNYSWIDLDITGTFYYVLNSVVKSFALSEAAVNHSYICISPNSSSFTGNYSLYYSSTDYPQRRYYVNAATFNNITQNIPLYALGDLYGIYARFQVIDQYSNPLSQANGDMKKTIGGVPVTVEKENTDDSGLATFWVDPNTDYEFTFSKPGCVTSTFTLRPTSTEIYTVTMSCAGTTTATNSSYTTGVAYSFKPLTDLYNATTYNFMFNMTSSYWAITGLTLYLKDNTSTTITSGAGTCTASTCGVTLPQNTGTYTQITSEAHYFLNGTEIIVSRIYSVKYSYTGDFSLRTFVDDLSSFGMNGFNAFSRMFLALLIITMVTWAIAYKMDVTEPEMLVVAVIFMVWIFSYIGWFSLSYYDTKTTIEGYLWLKKYMIALIVTVIGGSYVLKKYID